MYATFPYGVDSHYDDISFTHWVVPVVFFSIVFGKTVRLTPDTKRFGTHMFAMSYRNWSAPLPRLSAAARLLHVL